MKKHHRHENDCLNCGTELKGHFCYACGQENLHVKEPFWHFLSHSISHYFHFDEKFFSTIKPLLTQPGQLTLEYLAGRRTRFLHPISMYIFVSIVYFLVVPNLSPKGEFEGVEINNTSPAKAYPVVHINRDTNKKAKQPSAVEYNKGDTSNPLAKSITNNVLAQPLVKRALLLDSLKKTYKISPTEALKLKIDSLKELSKGPNINEENANEMIAKSGNPGLWRGLYNLWKTIRSPEFRKEMEHYKPKLYFILMPVFAFFLMLNFRRNHRYYVEHIVFTIHFFTAFFIFQTVVKPIDHFIFRDSSWFGLLMSAAVCWYCYTALRVFYQRPRWVTIRKMVTLTIFYGIAFLFSSTAIGAMVYLITK